MKDIVQNLKLRTRTLTRERPRNPVRRLTLAAPITYLCADRISAKRQQKTRAHTRANITHLFARTYVRNGEYRDLYVRPIGSQYIRYGVPHVPHGLGAQGL